MRRLDESPMISRRLTHGRLDEVRRSVATSYKKTLERAGPYPLYPSEFLAVVQVAELRRTPQVTPIFAQAKAAGLAARPEGPNWAAITASSLANPPPPCVIVLLYQAIAGLQGQFNFMQVIGGYI
jgi:hypothetical protein